MMALGGSIWNSPQLILALNSTQRLCIHPCLVFKYSYGMYNKNTNIVHYSIFGWKSTSLLRWKLINTWPMLKNVNTNHKLLFITSSLTAQMQDYKHRKSAIITHSVFQAYSTMWTPVSSRQHKQEKNRFVQTEKSHFSAWKE